MVYLPLIGLYTFVECRDGDPIYKHNVSGVYLSRKPNPDLADVKEWTVSNDFSVDHSIILNEKKNIYVQLSI